MSYRDDSDLVFLGGRSDDDLSNLVYVLTHDKDGEKRDFTGDLMCTAGYKTYFPHHHMYWKDIAAEIQCYGANTFATMFRGGKGVLYREVLIDVCDKFKVNYNEKSRTERIELLLLAKVFEDAVEQMSPEDLKKLAVEFGLNNTNDITAEVLTGSIMTIFRMGGFQSYRIAVTVANSVFSFFCGRGLTFATNALLTRTLSVLTGPIGWVLTALWTAVDIAGPAYRVTIPSVIAVAALRQKAMQS